MHRNDDPFTFTEACLDTPFGGPDREHVAEAHRRDDPSYLLDCPGTCLKSLEKDSSGWPVHCGILVTYNQPNNFVLVRGHGSPVSPACVWTGTITEYREMWEVD